MGSRLDLRMKVAVVDSAQDDPSVLTERLRSINGATGKMSRLVECPRADMRIEKVSRTAILPIAHDADENGDGDYLYGLLAPGWYETHSRGGTLTSQRVVFRIDGEGFPEVYRDHQIDQDHVLGSILGLDPDELATARAEAHEQRCAEAKALGLPPLVGSDRQIHYAMALRAVRLREARIMVDHEKPKYREVPGPYEQGLAFLRQRNEAGWWINLRNQPTSVVLAALGAGQEVRRGR